MDQTVPASLWISLGSYSPDLGCGHSACERHLEARKLCGNYARMKVGELVATFPKKNILAMGPNSGEVPRRAPLHRESPCGVTMRSHHPVVGPGGMPAGSRPWRLQKPNRGSDPDCVKSGPVTGLFGPSQAGAAQWYFWGSWEERQIETDSGR